LDYVKKGKIKTRARLISPLPPAVSSKSTKGVKIWVEIDGSGMVSFTTRSRFGKGKTLPMSVDLHDPDLAIEFVERDEKTINFRKMNQVIICITSKKRKSLDSAFDFVKKLAVEGNNRRRSSEKQTATDTSQSGSI
jgi:hypothetical protein